MVWRSKEDDTTGTIEDVVEMWFRSLPRLKQGLPFALVSFRQCLPLM